MYRNKMKRYVLESPREIVEEVFGVKTDNESLFEPNYNVVPGNVMPIIMQGDGGREIVSSVWGLEQKKTGKSISSIRYEEISGREDLKTLVKSSPCIIPASGFYKWKETVDDPLPFYLRVLSQEVTGLAGLYSTFTNEEGRKIHTFLVLTMQANPLVEPLDDTMPVILRAENYERWLNKYAPEMIEKGFSGNYLLPDMSVFRVPELVNDPSNNRKELIQPIPKLRNYDGEDED